MAGFDNEVLKCERGELTRSSSGQWMQCADGTDTFGLYNHAGDPNGTVSADTGSFCSDTTNGVVYVKTTDTANTGWVLLSQGLSTPVAVDEGGTGATSLTDGGLLEGNGTSAVESTQRPRYVAGRVENLGIDYNGGTGVFTVQGATASLSATNPAYVTLHSKADPGELVLYTVTADQSFIDDVGSSEIIGNLFGMTTGVAYTQDSPFYLYAVGNDDEDAIAFMISRDPTRTTSPAVANIGAPDDPVADTQSSFFSLENIDETLYDENPCMCIGAFRMRMSASDDWTVQTLSNADGIGKFHEETKFLIPTGTFGAASGTYILSNAGTEPTWSTQQIRYKIHVTGQIELYINLATNTGGSGGQIIQLVLPYANNSSYQYGYVPALSYTTSAGVPNTMHVAIAASAQATSSGSPLRIDGNASGFVNGSFGAGDNLQGLITYQAFN